MLSSFRDVPQLRYLLVGIVATLAPLFCCDIVVAQGSSSIAQQFQVKDGGITAASLVNIVKDNPNYVELSDADHADRLVGIVSDKPLIELSDGASGVQVVTSGITFALVSDLNGTVKVGDRITSSPISGVGMKALATTVTVGTAQADLSSVKNEARTVSDRSGAKQEVKIGLIPIQVSVAFYSPDKDKQQSGFVPAFLQNLANNVTGRDVSPVRVLVAALILLLLFLSVTVLLYSSVRSSIISIGRNPLSESAVRKSLFQVGITILAVLIFTVAVVYLVLTI